MMSWIGLHKCADVIFGIITSNLVSLKSNWSLFLDIFLFLIICPLKGAGFERKNKVNLFKAF